jgi:O-antigen ligase
MMSRFGEAARHLPSWQESALWAMAPMALGVCVGVVVLYLADLELKWVAYALGGLIALVVLAVVQRRREILWIALVLSLQFNISLRAFYGHAGSAGLEFPLSAMAGFLFLGWLFVSGEFRRLSPVRWGGPLVLPIAAVFVTSIMSMAGSTEHFIGLTAFWAQVQLLLIYLLVLNCVRTEDQLRSTLKLLFFVLAVQCVVYYIESIFQVTFILTGETRAAGQLARPGGTVGTTPSGFTDFILPLLLVATALFFRPRLSVRSTYYLGALVVLGLGALALTLTRAAWGGFGLALIWMVVFGHRQRMVSRAKLIALIASGLLIVAVAAPRIIMRLEGAPTDASYNERLALMKMAINVIEVHPIFGVGLGAYEMTYKHYLTPDLTGKWQWTVHNYYLLRTAETGILGGLAWLLLLATALRQAIRGRDSPHPLVRTLSVGWSSGIVAL